MSSQPCGVPGSQVLPKSFRPGFTLLGSIWNGGSTSTPSDGPPKLPESGCTEKPNASLSGPDGCNQTEAGVVPDPFFFGRLMFTARGSEKPRTPRIVPK